MRIWPDSLASRTLAILLGITLLLIAGSAILLQEERNTRFQKQNQFRLLNNIGTLVRLVEDAEPQGRQRIVNRISNDNFHASIAATPLVAGPPMHRMENFLARNLRKHLDMPMREINVRIRMVHDDDNDDEHMMQRGQIRPMMHEWGEMDFSIRLGDGSWLNIQIDKADAPPPWANKTLGLLILLAITLITGGMFAAHGPPHGAVGKSGRSSRPRPGKLATCRRRPARGPSYHSRLQPHAGAHAKTHQGSHPDAGRHIA